MTVEDWHKSSYSGGRNPDCLECRTTHDQVQVRDTQHRDHGHLGFPLAEWRAFLAQVRRDTV